MTFDEINHLPGVRRIENCSRDAMTAFALDFTHAVYPHDDVYGAYCTLEEYIDCPPEDVFAYLSDVNTLAEWTYSLRDPKPAGDGVVVFTDKVGGQTQCFTRVEAHRGPMTVDFHCAWDQGDHLWMIYLMRVIPAQRVLNKRGAVVTWTNCRHPFYDKNPRPELTPADRKVWVGDLWPFFYAGHHAEMQNLKHILEAQQARRVAA